MSDTNKLWTLLFAVVACSGAFPESEAPAEDRLPLSLNAEVRFLSRSTPPLVQEHWVVLSYRPAPAARYVAARFEHEGYAVLHPFQLNEAKTFVLVLRPPEGVDRLTYRISVDGIWMRDPANPDFSADGFGIEYSHVDLAGLLPEPEKDPVVRADGRVTFTYHGTPGRIVSIAASFNQWDPYVHALEEVADGTYSLTVRLPRGMDYYYYFLENGNKRLDPANGEIRHNLEGDLVCYFQIP
jgi:hypothetical protein